MKQPDYSYIERNPDLRRRLKEAAKESVLSFFPGRDPPEEALEYVVVAFCLGESKEEFNERLKQLFERDCQNVVESLTSFVNSHSEFSSGDLKKATETISTTPQTEEKPKRSSQVSQKEELQPQRQKIVWDPSLDAPSKDSEVKTPAEKVEIGKDRWQGENKEVVDKTETSQQRKMPNFRLFESALGGIKDQFHPREPLIRPSGPKRMKPKRGENAEFVKNGKTKIVEPVEKEQGSILSRIRKPDGTPFEEWELRSENFPQVRKRQAASLEHVRDGEGSSEVEELKRKIARLEQEVHSSQVPGRQYSSQRQDIDRWSVCVKNVHFLANEEVVAAHFHSCAPIVNIRFAKDMYGHPKGFCFIQFAYEECVNRALDLNQSILLGRNISVVRKLSRPPPLPPQQRKVIQSGPTRMAISNLMEPTTQENEAEEKGQEAQPDIKDFGIDTGYQENP